jgi:hypothetical protein
VQSDLPWRAAELHQVSAFLAASSAHPAPQPNAVWLSPSQRSLVNKGNRHAPDND